MPFRRQHTRLTQWSAVVGIAVTLAMAGAQRSLQISAAESVEWVHHTFAVERSLDALHAAVAEAESAQRGFLRTNDPRHLTQYRDAVSAIEMALSNATDLTADNPGQQARVNELRQATRQRRDQLDAALNTTISVGPAAAMGMTFDQDSALTDRIRQTIRDAHAEEQRLLATRNATMARETSRQNVITWALVALNAGVLLAFFAAARRLARLEPFITVCAWSKTIRYNDDWITFEEYLWHRFGIRASHGISPDQEQHMRTEIEAARHRTSRQKTG